MKVTMTWKQADFGAVMSESLQLLHMGSNETGVEKDVVPSSPKIGTMEVKEFCLDDVKGPVSTTQRVNIPPFSTVSVHSNISVRGHCLWVHVLSEPMPGPQLPTVVVPTVTYGELHQGSSGTHLSVQLECSHSIKIPTKTVVGWVVPTNHIPPVVIPTGISEESISNPQRDGSWRPWTFKAFQMAQT